ncbi:zinc finger MYND domain-containing protein [Phanerochaete sordida]|uniref:Zinc finger MYND domain-containing protein n=1 Tax=Phanerochaete sordida TaxID=48140 RepID=A0A9P3FY62_9APHY|nr:zinc finger MYND domain-containing protein [Phanerochaete sordida]
MSSKTSTAAPSETYLDLLMIVYGSTASDPLDDSRFCGEGQRRVEVRLAPAIPPDAATSLRRRQEWAHKLAQRTTLDMKHSQAWHCEFCDKLARESFVQNAGWFHLDPPKLNIYVHLVCNSVVGPCAARLRETADLFAEQSGGGPDPHKRMPDRFAPAHRFPPAASCLCCQAEQTVGKELKRCGACKLVRYCSAACQKEDWGRHKATCKAIKEVKWVWK